MQQLHNPVRSDSASAGSDGKEYQIMRFLILAAAAGAVALPAGAASAQYYGGYGNGYGYGYGYGYGRNDRVRQEQRECQRELRRADSRREYIRELRECRREIAQARRYSRYGYGDRYGYDRARRYWDGYRWRYGY
jgi:hypothetical protein